MRPEVRTEELTSMKKVPPRSPQPDAALAAGLRLLETYAGLAERGEHLLSRLLAGHAPRQWAHYPEDDAIDYSSGYQWFYHSHSPEDRPGAVEHGHIHLFARQPLWGRRLCSGSERAFAALSGNPSTTPTTRHLLTIGLDAKGLPISLFTVNSWVTGDLMLGADLTLELLASMTLDTGHPEVDAVIASVARLCAAELQVLMQRRDDALRSHSGPDKLQDEALELLSELRINLDAKLSALSTRRSRIIASHPC
ncbi:hypothetical protein E7Z57_03565 [Ralstonia pseudosolanacearum]|uniref:DUF6969 domain-containing protein n=2 Tax=Ralstonia solanacearum species complex TaxID=3116862 RepID=A0AA92ICY3_RALSL|nr:hypothetical protein E7Z57_03565 [Ralstonia pseudosolanacearum]